jgi:hypothetical protein
MHDKTARVFSGLGVLVVVWIVVYWSGPSKTTGSTASLAGRAPEASGGWARVIDRREGRGRFPRDRGDPVRR